ncbi:PREDICTED: collectin-10-like [Branchiostoma belcheri]|uniref:Collectin-10-like n=1 Tax=Branchiostoma belcheri TaxID=7741 RepID=A0A6P4YFV3_BRABE|nr:PREDICTED: collectin-10-like [Branchiostoma belcheri]
MTKLEEQNIQLQVKLAHMEQRLNDVSEELCACKEKTHVCPAGDILICDRCYSLPNIYVKKNYTEARSVCQAAGGHLAMPKDKKTNDFLARVLQSLFMFVGRRRHSVWIGLTDRSEMGTSWMWEDGTPLAGWNNWAAGRPQNPLHGAFCACWDEFHGYNWNDAQCGSDDFNYLCEKPATVKP